MMRTFRIATILGCTLLITPLLRVHGQTGVTAAEPMAWQAWAFGRLGAASSAPVSVATSGAGALISLGAGATAAYGMAVGMVRVTESSQFFVGPGVRDDALLIGLRSRSHHLFIVGAAGIAQAAAFETSDDGGTFTGPSRAAFAYDVSAHAAFRVTGLALAISGVVGPEKTSYVAVTLGAEFGWFGR